MSMTHLGTRAQTSQIREFSDRWVDAIESLSMWAILRRRAAPRLRAILADYPTPPEAWTASVVWVRAPDADAAAAKFGEDLRAVAKNVYVYTPRKHDRARDKVRDQARHQVRHLVILLAPGWTPDPKWRTETVQLLARGIVADRAFDRLPILADALQEAGCDDDEWLTLMRDPTQPWFAAAGVLRSLA